MAVARPQALLRFLRVPVRPLVPSQSSTCCVVRFRSSSTKASRFRVSYLWYALCLAGGLGIGTVCRTYVAPAPLPAPGSHGDEVVLGDLGTNIDQLDVVKSLRAQGYHLHSDVSLDGATKGNGSWTELGIKRSLTEAAQDRDSTTRTITQRSLAGARGFGVQRAFWNPDTREMIAVVWMGGALSGWPGMVHGGAAVTLFEDAMARTIAGPNVSLDSIPPLLSVSVTYARPTHILNFYILRTRFETPKLPQAAPPLEPAPAKSWLPPWKDLMKKPTPIPDPVELIATLESLDGTVCVRARGIWPTSPL
ncbi:hypothetical protein EJ04DRAFT_574513 [Polyplosphaeria fusca]|uniref:Thioesterase domain-containing protein n=1 Tax=Polyplosphaeria fusca TaxID=682080 RepID=A0A9P4R2N8_9PLEO|nr:hypothetical protein EJ04DRAFT_574513 [Polyplosphaeria fusca]